jgi:ABC-2 type transport system permease protein
MKTNLEEEILVPIIKLDSIITYDIKQLFEEIYGMIQRLSIQTFRRPSALIAGTLQPLLWFFLFGALFENLLLKNTNIPLAYSKFLSIGIITFAAFSGALNAGLSIIFDREFGFLSRFLVYPLRSRISILLASIIFVILISILQVLLLLLITTIRNNSYELFNHFLSIIFIIFLLTTIVSLISINSAFILPGHIELLAFILIVNLPVLFSSTALVPFDFMPKWLQFIAFLNPLTYAIESLRSIYGCNANLSIIKPYHAIAVLFIADIIGLLFTYVFFEKKYK